MLQALIGLFELPEDDTIPDEEHFIDIEDTPGYQTAFSQLAFAGKKEHDPVGQMVNNPRIHLAQSLHKLSTACPGRVGDFHTWHIKRNSTEKKRLYDSGSLLIVFDIQQDEIYHKQNARCCFLFCYR